MTDIGMLTWLKGPAWAAVKTGWSRASEAFAKRSARRKALAGEDLAGRGTLQSLVRKQLESLANVDAERLPAGVQRFAFRNWVERPQNLEFFVDALIARMGGSPEASSHAERQLAVDYERLTHGSMTVATHQVRLVVSYVYGQLNATAAGKQALERAVQQRTLAEVSRRSDPNGFHSEDALARARGMGALLLAAGKLSWKMPRFVAPLTVEAYDTKDEEKPRPTTIPELTSSVASGASLVLFGDGGIGKTTFLLELCEASLADGCRIPLFADAAIWARSRKTLFDYLSELPAARAHSVTSYELTRLAQAGQLVVLLNGWNEMPAAAKLGCRDGLMQLAAGAQNLPIVTVSRSATDTPGIPNARRIEVRGLTWRGQVAVIRAELGQDDAAPLLELLAKDTRLRHAARSPLILRGVIARARAGSVASASVFDLLGAAVRAFEEGEQRSLVLRETPVEGHHTAYLEELACSLTSRGVQTCSREEALQAMHAAASHLAGRALIGSVQPGQVLDVLISHHLLHSDGDVVRFAHQRFQEYFAAGRLLRACVQADGDPDLLRRGLNDAAWADALSLVAGKLAAPASAAPRVRIIEAALAMDLGQACDLAGMMRFSQADDAHLYHRIVTRTRQLSAAPLKEVRELGIALQIFSGLPDFATDLWPLLEALHSNDHGSIFNEFPISLRQLGPEAAQRIARWAPKQRAKFVHDVAENDDNYEYLVELARTESDTSVEAAAITSLFWHFPASDAPYQAWLEAPIEVQTEQQVLSYMQYAVRVGYASEDVKAYLRSRLAEHLSIGARVQLALEFPQDLGPALLDALFVQLRSAQFYDDDGRLLSVAQSNAPDRLREFAGELALGARPTPAWVGAYLQKSPAQVKADLFDQAWSVLLGPSFDTLNEENVGPLANQSQISRAITSILEYVALPRDSMTETGWERHRKLQRVFAHAPGELLLAAVMERSAGASYEESVELLDLLLHRLGRYEESNDKSGRWLPSLEDVRNLVNAYQGKTPPEDDFQNTVAVHLCRIASRVAPAEFEALLLETCRRHLDAWSRYKEMTSHWGKKSGTQRPNGPQWGDFLATALMKRGPEFLPALLAMMSHRNAMEFVPHAISRVATSVWPRERPDDFDSVAVAIREGEKRRALRRDTLQPNDAFQGPTDEAARLLAEKLAESVALHSGPVALGQEKMHRMQAESRVGWLASLVANIPSPSVVQPVYGALQSGLMNAHGTVGTLKGLVCQGARILDDAVIRSLEATYERTAGAGWHNESAKHTLAEFVQLLLCTIPSERLSHSTDHYLKEWRRFAYPGEIVRKLGDTRSGAGWPILVQYARGLGDEARKVEGLLNALASTLTRSNVSEFFDLVADGTLGRWCESGWALERVAPVIAQVVTHEASLVDAFLDACRQANSEQADAIAGHVLSDNETYEMRAQAYLLEALDRGRAATRRQPAAEFLLGMFTRTVRISESQSESSPKANNALRAQLYARAKGSGPVAAGCRRMLASLEYSRRENDRPIDEVRHPARSDGVSWMDALL